MGHCAKKIVVGTLNEHARGGGVTLCKCDLPVTEVTFFLLN